MSDNTDAQILYELARNQVYGELSRSIEGFRQNSHGLLAEERKKVVPEMANDAFFYRQVIAVHNCLGALQEFCEARHAGMDYYNARHKLMDVFAPFTDKPFSDDDYVCFPPSYMDPMHETTEAEKESAYRWRHIDEFRTTVHVLDMHLRQAQAASWSTDIIFANLHNRLDAFMDREEAEKGFEKFPVPSEIKYFAEAAKWLKERSTLAAARANVHISIDTTGLKGIFGKLTGNTLPEKLKYAHYSQHCENMGASLTNMVTSTEYLKMLLKGCAVPRVNGRSVVGNYNSPVAVNLPQALAEFSTFYLGHYIDGYPEPQDKAEELCMRDAIDSGDAAVADFFDEFVFDEKRKPEPVHKPLVFQDLKI